ncbi:hypothetical protein [Salmonella enterica]|uniref:hypothetical protein n=1 Tax=Salmonella enterica TaxID=28901 RepID=UPI000D3DD9D9|nr:hypothetical protein [Salmonella enterica]EFC4831988.1 hypothetical protein [Escherichia coli]EIT5442058.1 hypothetical protein [Salmonella enterica]PUS92281.1 hypothetical protein B1L87_14275 [Salmonella enterica subsp. enterica serovar Dublin]
MTVSLLARVQANVPVWAHEQLAAWDAAEFAAMSDFITEHYWTGQGSINVYRIVGTDHPQYAGMTWLELLERGKRMDINIPLLEKNPGYYTQAEQQHAGMSFVSTDGIHWYVSADGNHRSCLARFLFHLQGEGRTQLHNVAQSVYHTDREFRSACREIHNLTEPLSRHGVYLRLQTRRQCVSREDLACWKVDRFSTEALLTVDDVRAGGHDRPSVYKALLLNAADAWREVMVLQRRLEALSASPEKNLPRSWWLRLLQRGTRS